MAARRQRLQATAQRTQVRGVPGRCSRPPPPRHGIMLPPPSTVRRRAPEVIMHFELFTFAPPNPWNDSATQGWYDYIGPFFSSLDDANVQTVSALSDRQNPMCCSGAHSVHGSANDKDILLLNGGYQPKLTMKAGQWQRWRMVHTGYKRFLDLQILDKSGGVAPSCQLMLLAKDGVYIPQMPRAVDPVFLTAGARRAPPRGSCRQGATLP